MTQLIQRPRRLRRTQRLRSLLQETRVSKEALIQPVFVVEGEGVEREIPSMPGQFQYSVDKLIPFAEKVNCAGIGGLLYFGIPNEKDTQGSAAWNENGPVQRALRAVKQACPDLIAITDVCLCEYTSHGHCGCLDSFGGVDNDATLPLLAKVAMSHAENGADIVAPSDMMDGRVGALRLALDSGGYSDCGIFSYAIKYCSACYGPFRVAAESAPKVGDRRSYQMDHHNSREALRELALDEGEGADGIIVKPGLPYLDILRTVRDHTNLPLLSYWVSGEYAMLKAASKNGWVDEERLTGELATCFFRAGADMLITYSALDLAELFEKGIWR